jgi:hypothetical protein
MDDHKPVMISISIFKTWERCKFFFFKKKICLENFLGFGRMHEILLLLFSGENRVFNTGFVFYNVNIQPDIMQNW